MDSDSAVHESLRTTSQNKNTCAETTRVLIDIDSVIGITSNVPSYDHGSIYVPARAVEVDMHKMLGVCPSMLREDTSEIGGSFLITEEAGK